MFLTQFIRKYISTPSIRIIANIFLKFHWLDKFILVRMDGGICSQMHFYLIGNEFEKHGFRVKYNLEWFRKLGMDMNGVHVRNFDLTKAFPSLPFKQANMIESTLYQAFAKPRDYSLIDPSEWVTAIPPAYLNGYYRTPQGMYNTIPDLFNIDLSVLDERNLALYNEIEKNDNSVAVHVRRGDLAVFNNAYGEPVGMSYFQKSIEYIEKYMGCSGYYYFFSDEPDWVKDVLIHNLELSDNYQVVDFNGSDKGYMDLFLISSCRHQITSKGSLGKFGGLLRKSRNNKIIICDDEYQRNEWDNQSSSVVFIKP